MMPTHMHAITIINKQEHRADARPAHTVSGIISSLLVLCLIFSSLSGCHKETEQEKVKKVITTIQKAAEEKEIKAIRNSISESYTDPQGNNYASVNRLVIAYFYQHPKITIYITSLKVSSKDDTARAEFQAVLTSSGQGKSTSSILPEALGRYVFDVTFRKESGEWKVVSAVWERVGDSAGQ
jgi:hypothetical protein